MQIILFRDYLKLVKTFHSVIEFIKRNLRFYFSSKRRTLGIIGTFLVLLILPVILIEVKQQQDLRQHADYQPIAPPAPAAPAVSDPNYFECKNGDIWSTISPDLNTGAAFSCPNHDCVKTDVGVYCAGTGIRLKKADSPDFPQLYLEREGYYCSGKDIYWKYYQPLPGKPLEPSFSCPTQCNSSDGVIWCENKDLFLGPADPDKYYKTDESVSDYMSAVYQDTSGLQNVNLVTELNQSDNEYQQYATEVGPDLAKAACLKTVEKKMLDKGIEEAAINSTLKKLDLAFTPDDFQTIQNLGPLLDTDVNLKDITGLKDTMIGLMKNRKSIAIATVLDIEKDIVIKHLSNRLLEEGVSKTAVGAIVPGVDLIIAGYTTYQVVKSIHLGAQWKMGYVCDNNLVKNQDTILVKQIDVSGMGLLGVTGHIGCPAGTACVPYFSEGAACETQSASPTPSPTPTLTPTPLPPQAGPAEQQLEMPAAATFCIDGNPGTVRFNWTRRVSGLTYRVEWDQGSNSVPVGDTSELVQSGFGPGGTGITWRVKSFDSTGSIQDQSGDKNFTVPLGCSAPGQPLYSLPGIAAQTSNDTTVLPTATPIPAVASGTQVSCDMQIVNGQNVQVCTTIASAMTSSGDQAIYTDGYGQTITNTGNTRSGSIGASCSTKSKGDANCDGKIDSQDFDIWRSEFGKTLRLYRSDFNKDGKIDLLDFAIWKQNTN